MPKPSEKTFFNIIQLSEEFRAATVSVSAFPDERTQRHFELITWQIKAQLAIAQQLSVISKHLGEIVEKSKVTE